MDPSDKELCCSIGSGNCRFSQTCPHKRSPAICMSSSGHCSGGDAFIFLSPSQAFNPADLENLDMLKKVFLMKESGYWRI